MYRQGEAQTEIKRMQLDWITFYNISRSKCVKSRSGNDAEVSGTLLEHRVPREYGAGRVENI